MPDTRNELYKVNEVLKFKTDYNEMHEGPEEPNEFEDLKQSVEKQIGEKQVGERYSN